MAALDKWIDHAEAIEADLFLAGHEIGHWHQLTINPDTRAPRLSSRRLLVLLHKFEFDGDSEYSKSLEGRTDDWSENQQIRAWHFNETARLHHTLQAVNADPEQWENYDPPRFLSHAERESYWRDVETEDEQLHEDVEEFDEWAFS